MYPSFNHWVTSRKPWLRYQGLVRIGSFNAICPFVISSRQSFDVLLEADSTIIQIEKRYQLRRHFDQYEVLKDHFSPLISIHSRPSMMIGQRLRVSE